MSLTTPNSVTNDIQLFSQRLVADSDPLYVDYIYAAGAVTDECFDNVDRLVVNRGGRTLLGWMIWEWENVLLEAIFHAVWEDEDGILHDPTPKTDGESRVLFLPDRSTQDNGGVTPNQYQPLRDWIEITEYISACNNISEVQRQYYPNIPRALWYSSIQRKEECEQAIHRRILSEVELFNNQNELLNGISISEDIAQRRAREDIADVEARTTHARYLASHGDFQSAFEILLESAKQSQDLAKKMGETFRLLFSICDNLDLVNRFRREWSQWLH